MNKGKKIINKFDNNLFIFFLVKKINMCRNPPELPIFKPGTWIIIRSEYHGKSEWAMILEKYSDSIDNDYHRNIYTCAKFSKGCVELFDIWDYDIFPEGITYPSFNYKKKLLKNLKKSPRFWKETYTDLIEIIIE